MGELRIALLGTNGHQVFSQLPSVPGARLVGVADVPDDRMDDLARKHPEVFAGAGRYSGRDEMLDGSGAELVSICSARRDRQHEDVVEALRAGCHVYAEKPLATTMAGLEAIRAAAAEAGREARSMTGFMYGETCRTMRSLVESGDLGTIVQVFAQKSYPYHDGRPQDEGVDGGLLMQAGIHAVSYVRYVTGLEFEEVAARETLLGNPEAGSGGGLRIAAQVSARMTGGALCAIVINYCNPKGIGFWGNDQLRVFGTGGMAEAVDGFTRATATLGDGKPGPLPLDSSDGAGYGGLFGDYVRYLIELRELRGLGEAGEGAPAPMLLTQEDSLENTRVVIRADEAAKSGARASLAPPPSGRPA